MSWQLAWDYEKAERRAAEDEGYDDRDRPSPADLEDDRRPRILSRAQFERREGNAPTIEDEMERRAWTQLGEPD
jgi:hypothetical protein